MQLARESLLHFLRREPDRIVLVGPISLRLRGGYGLSRTEALLDSLVEEGVLRMATTQELGRLGLHHGYYLTPEGRSVLPTEEPPCGVHDL